MKWIISRYNHDLSYLPEYTNDYVIYDRSPDPLPNSIIVPNVGTDIYDKFTYIIDNYDNLPDVAVYTKANIFKYITKEEFDLIKDNKTFTPILTQGHKVYNNGNTPVCFYKDGMYFEINNGWYLNSHPPRTQYTVNELSNLLGIADMMYVPFAPGSNYILTRESILQHPKHFYEKLRTYLTWDRYPGEAQIIERGLYTLWRP